MAGTGKLARPIVDCGGLLCQFESGTADARCGLLTRKGWPKWSERMTAASPVRGRQRLECGDKQARRVGQSCERVPADPTTQKL